MSTYVISDIHGCYDELQELLELIKFSSRDTLYILGDLIDRGPKNPECIEWMVQSKSNVIYLLGNHELMMMTSMNDNLSNFKQNPASKGIWCAHGGTETFLQCKDNCSSKLMKAFQSKIENANIIASPKVGKTYPVLVHAGLKIPNSKKKKSWSRQKDAALLWSAKEWQVDKQVPPFNVIFGHTPTATLARRIQSLGLCSEKEINRGKKWHIMCWNHKWAIDCGCVFGGNLGALRLDDYKRFYVPCCKSSGYA